MALIKLQFYTLDVFTTHKFAGNPLAVVLDADDLSAQQMQTIAGEFNLPETTFILKPDDLANTAKMRIFTPRRELPFAGHPTIGAAILLAQLYDLSQIRLELKAGLTSVNVAQNAGHPSATLTAPIVPFAIDLPLPSPTETAQALSLNADDIGFGDHKVAIIEGGPRFFFVPLKDREALARCQIAQPYWSELLERINNGVEQSKHIFGCYVYTRGGDHEDTSFRVRMFAPTGGIPEDPATGSATALLAAQLLKAELLKAGTHIWHLEQGYEMGRPSQLRLEADIANDALKAVRLGGHAIQMFKGTLTI